MRRDQRPHLVVPTNAGRAWQEREPRTWVMVCEWLAERGKHIGIGPSWPPLTSPSAHAHPYA